MTITELAAHDAADRQRINANVTAEVERELGIAVARHGVTDHLERHLAQLQAGAR
jgi:hypothetical protein